MNTTDLADLTWDQLKAASTAAHGMVVPSQILTTAAEHARQHIRVSTSIEMAARQSDDTGPDVTRDDIAAVLTRAVNAGIALKEVDAFDVWDPAMIDENGQAFFLAGEVSDADLAAAIAHAAVETALLQQAAAHAANRAAALVALYNGAQVVAPAPATVVDSREIYDDSDDGGYESGSYFAHAMGKD